MHSDSVEPPNQWWRAGLKLLWAAYMLLTSFYCVLAFFPYTYYALIKSPAYDWMPWFAHQHARLYWLALIALAIAYSKDKKRVLLASLILGPLVLAGILITVRPLLPNLNSDAADYAWSLAALAPVLALAAVDVVTRWPRGPDRFEVALSYLPAVLSAIALAVMSALGQRIQDRDNANPSLLQAHPLAIGVWSIVTHIVVAFLAVSILNLIFRAAAKTAQPRVTRGIAVGLAIFCGGVCGLASFLNNALGFRGWMAWLYSSFLVATLLLLAGSLVLQAPASLRSLWKQEGQGKPVVKALSVFALVGLGALALVLPSTIGQWDWNGLFQWMFTLLLWFAVTACFYALARPRAPYSWPAIVAVLLVTGAAYKMTQTADVVWGKSLGPTGEDIGHAFEQYASLDLSFRFAHHLLGNSSPEDSCEDLCRILRSYTNVRDAKTTRQIEFVDHLVPTTGKRPNIIMIVVDSLRPDFLGAYNSKVDFTPNLDALAADSVVFRNTYSQYAGTYLSEPAIWSGAMLLHAHYLRPFQNVNALEKLVNTDGYKMIVSFDNVLREILSPQDDVIKLDTDKTTWKALDLCSTVTQLSGALDTRPVGAGPVFFYAQPQNVHMFAANNQPTWRTANWRSSGFNARIALEVHQVDQCVGNLLSDLKSRGLYDESIIIVTSDHGDATGEFGRRAHSYQIYPEIMRVPLIVHLPSSMRGKFAYDADRITTLTDITPSLYYLLGHRPVRQDPMLGRPLFAATRQELDRYPRNELFLASDEVAVYGILDNGRYMYATYASPARSFLFDLVKDPNAEHSILTAELKRHYDQRVLDNLKMIGDFYGYRIGINSLLASQAR